MLKWLVAQGVSPAGIFSLRRGFGLDKGRATEEPKLLKWLAAQGVSVGAIQKGWQAGAVKDGHIALLIRYAATESQAKPAEAQRWQRYLDALGSVAGISVHALVESRSGG